MQGFGSRRIDAALKDNEAERAGLSEEIRKKDSGRIVAENIVYPGVKMNHFIRKHQHQLRGTAQCICAGSGRHPHQSDLIIFIYSVKSFCGIWSAKDRKGVIIYVFDN